METMKGKKVALIGVSRGLGAATAYELLTEGASVIISARTESRLREIADSMKSVGNIEAVQGDVSTADGASRLASRFSDIAGTLDGLCIMVGGFAQDSIAQPIALDEMLDNHVRAVIHAVSSLMGIMNRNGSIVLMSNASSLDRGASASMSYSIAKGAVIRIAELLCPQLIPKAIRVNVVAPSFIDGEFKPGRDFLLLRKLGSYRVPPEGIASVITFLLSDRSSWVNGATIPVDGGNRLAKI